MPRTKGSKNKSPPRNHRVTINLNDDELSLLNYVGVGNTRQEMLRNLAFRNIYEVAADLVNLGVINNLPKRSNSYVLTLAARRKRS